MSKTAFWISVCMVGCVSAAPLDVQAQDSAVSRPAWAGAVDAAVAADPSLAALNPTDIANYCPRYGTLDDAGRDAFWSDLLVRIAEVESGGNVARTRWLAFDTALHRPTFRRGLFQISIEAARSQRFNCTARTSAELIDPAGGAACAVRIVESTIGAEDTIAAGGRYWPSLGHTANRNLIAAETAADGPCNEAQP